MGHEQAGGKRLRREPLDQGSDTQGPSGFSKDQVRPGRSGTGSFDLSQQGGEEGAWLQRLQEKK